MCGVRNGHLPESERDFQRRKVTGKSKKFHRMSDVHQTSGSDFCLKNLFQILKKIFQRPKVKGKSQKFHRMDDVHQNPGSEF